MTSGDAIPHVIVVDDEPDLLHVVGNYLNRIGFRATTCGGVDEALRLANTDTPDLVLTDLCLGVSDGMALAERLWALHPELPVVLMSGATPELAGSVPGLVFVPKPFTLPEIASALRKVWREHSEPQEACLPSRRSRSSG
jgi:DNA-binding response OmpR family regulator